MTCPICLSLIQHDMTRTPCQHIFHYLCLQQYIQYNNSQWKATRCPICRFILVPRPIFDSYDRPVTIYYLENSVRQIWSIHNNL